MAVKSTRSRSSGTRHAFASQENIYLGARPESASADSGRAKVPEGVRFAGAAPEVFMIRQLGPRPDPAGPDLGRWLMLGDPPGSPRPPPLVRFADKALRAFPEGVRFADKALRAFPEAGRFAAAAPLPPSPLVG